MLITTPPYRPYKESPYWEIPNAESISDNIVMSNLNINNITKNMKTHPNHFLNITKYYKNNFGVWQI